MVRTAHNNKAAIGEPIDEKYTARLAASQGRWWLSVRPGALGMPVPAQRSKPVAGHPEHLCEVVLQGPEGFGGVAVRALPTLFCLYLGVLQDPVSLRLGRPGYLVLGCHLHGPLLGMSNRTGSLLLGLLDDPLPLPLKALRLLDLLGHSHPQLVNYVKTLVLVDHRLPGEGDPGSAGDDCLQPVEQIENIHVYTSSPAPRLTPATARMGSCR